MSNLLEAIQVATQDDLEAIQKRIAELSAELEALKAACRIVEIKLNGKPDKKPKAVRADAAKLRELIYDCISANGPGTAEHIAMKIGRTTQQVAVCAGRCDWFTKLDSGKLSIAITGAGD